MIGSFALCSRCAANPDVLICGNCREMFSDLAELLEHKRDYCKLRFTCKCHAPTVNGPTQSTYEYIYFLF